MKRNHRLIIWILNIIVLAVFVSGVYAGSKGPIVKAMEEELTRSFQTLKDSGEAPLYYMNYAINEEIGQKVSAEFGAVINQDSWKIRDLDVDVRVGSMQLDNTHELRGRGRRGFFGRSMGIPRKAPLDDSLAALKQKFWLATDKEFKNAQKKYMKVKSNVEVKVEEEDTSADFSPAKSYTYYGSTNHKKFNMQKWREKVKEFSNIYDRYEKILNSKVSLKLKNINKYMTNTDGTRIRMGQTFVRLSTFGLVKAEDGMRLYLHKTFDGSDISELPSDEEIKSSIDSLINDLLALRDAPVIDPYEGPAILMNEASGVFFHEIFGHRIEGHRQKEESEGKTFTDKVGEEILPEFISIYDDPTKKYFGDQFIRGYYKYDDQGLKAQKVPVVKNGILKNFLLSRSLVEGFESSNAHGRRSPHRDITSRQGNLIVQSDSNLTFKELKKRLIEECKRQDKEWGLIFENISGGFTMTMKFLPQSFKVMPLKVWRVYADDGHKELVRGVDIVGTPLTSFSKIMATANDPVPFNGTCGAESGYVPVSAVSPSILVKQIEVQKKSKSQERPPILPPPSK